MVAAPNRTVVEAHSQKLNNGLTRRRQPRLAQAEYSVSTRDAGSGVVSCGMHEMTFGGAFPRGSLFQWKVEETS